MSAHTALHGKFHFEATPMALPGTKTLVHAKPGSRLTWAFHAIDAWYVVPALDHYRCDVDVLADNGGERTTDTVKFQHHVVVVPRITPTDRVIQATRELTRAIRQEPTMAPPEHIEAIQRLCIIIQERTGTSSEGAQNNPKTRSEGTKSVTSAKRSEGANISTPNTTNGTQQQRV